MIGSTECLDKVGCVEETITTGGNVAKVSTWAAQLGLSIGDRTTSGGVHFEHRLDSNVLGQLAVEARTTAWYQTVGDSVIARGEAFGGTATHYLDVDARGDERFVGGALDLSYRVAPQWWLGLQVDALRAFDRAPVLEGRVAGSGVRAFATLGWTTELYRQAVQLPPVPEPPPPPLPVDGPAL